MELVAKYNGVMPLDPFPAISYTPGYTTLYWSSLFKSQGLILGVPSALLSLHYY